jgi:hypothetical protein
MVPQDAALFLDFEETRELLGQKMRSQRRRVPLPREVDAVLVDSLRRSGDSIQLDATVLPGIPVISGDEAAAYVEALPAGKDLGDVIASVAPPFERFWIDFQGVQPASLEVSS